MQNPSPETLRIRCTSVRGPPLWWGYVSEGKEPTCSAGDTGDLGSIPRLGTSPGGENGNPLLYSCLEKSMDRGAWWVIVHRVTKSQTQLRATSRHICGGHSSERKACCWHLKGGGQGCRSTPYTAQDSSQSKELWGAPRQQHPGLAAWFGHSDFALEKRAVVHRPYIMVCPQRGVE